MSEIRISYQPPKSKIPIVRITLLAISFIYSMYYFISPPESLILFNSVELTKEKARAWYGVLATITGIIGYFILTPPAIPYNDLILTENTLKIPHGKQIYQVISYTDIYEAEHRQIPFSSSYFIKHKDGETHLRPQWFVDQNAYSDFAEALQGKITNARPA